MTRALLSRAGSPAPTAQSSVWALSQSRSHLLRTEQYRPGAFFVPELLHQLSATFALLPLVPKSLDCLLSSKSSEGSLRPACLEVIAQLFHHFLSFSVYRLVDDASKPPRT
jgi:hypothetical protein